MATIFMSKQLPVAATKAWRRIAAVDKVDDILPGIASCKVEGDQRLITLADGAMLRENILAIDDDLMRLAYGVAESPFGLDHHASSMQITGSGETCTVHWTTDFKPDGFKDVFTPMLGQMFMHLSDRLAAA